MKAVKQYFHVVLFITLHKVVLSSIYYAVQGGANGFQVFG